MNPSNLTNSTILLTFDVEDWFQVENFKQCIPFSSWPNCELRVEKNVYLILDLLDSISTLNPVDSAMSYAPSANSISQITPKGTFFVLGWIAERLPHLVREIKTRGHEVGSHGYYHELCGKQHKQELRKDLVKSKKILEDIIGSPVYGYRAPSFSINHDILKLIEETGFSYDSSFNSFGLNKRYGKLYLNGNNHNGILYKINDRFFELPISNLKIGRKVFPWGGGGYFRLMPFQVFRYGVEQILKKTGAYLWYLHPWEIDSDQPRVRQAALSYRFRHYANLKKTLNKLTSLLNTFRECRFDTCYRYLESCLPLKGVA